MAEGGLKYHSSFAFERHGDLLHVRTRGLTNHEMRNLLIGFWLTLDEADRRDHIAELEHLLDEPGSYPAPMAQEIADAINNARRAN